jgi:hypothetical protein
MQALLAAGADARSLDEVSPIAACTTVYLGALIVISVNLVLRSSERRFPAALDTHGRTRSGGEATARARRRRQPSQQGATLFMLFIVFSSPSL